MLLPSGVGKTSFFLFYCYFFKFYWNVIDLQQNVSLRYGAEWFRYTFLILFPYSLLQNVEQSFCAIQQVLVGYLFYILLLFSCSVVSNSLWPHGLQQARLPCPSPSLRACSNSCPLSPWCHPTISSSVVPFSSCLLSFQYQGLFLSWLFASGGRSIGASASASVLPMNSSVYMLSLSS